MNAIQKTVKLNLNENRGKDYRTKHRWICIIDVKNDPKGENFLIYVIIVVQINFWARILSKSFVRIVRVEKKEIVVIWGIKVNSAINFNSNINIKILVDIAGIIVSEMVVDSKVRSIIFVEIPGKDRVVFRFGLFRKKIVGAIQQAGVV